ncbi:DNA cytosine methyltransferase [Brevundimonas vancanneytii]|nr:DNA cytosine methyltransferase [Brevundimonas vancanneytii]
MGERQLRAIDLYSGVGGWSLGLRLAGIDVVASFERWGAANETNFKNNHHQAQTVDIRRLSYDDLPSDIDIVVGSPPCTQFSFSNRGGNGDLDDGLKDIENFLSIVDHLRPKVWAMENVPRVAGIIACELEPGGRLERFAHLGFKPHLISMDDYGVPQRRRRCVAGNFDFELLKEYSAVLERPTLGQVVKALAADPVSDPLFGIIMPRADLVDHVAEEPLSLEEVRINRANKANHTVYNAMPFPDPLDRSVRTITATCTRVSRESIVIAAPDTPNAYRRLTVRERASLQGFPITFQFYGQNYGQKLRMVGNAVPPAFAYLLGHALSGTPVKALPPLASHAASLRAPEPVSKETPPDRPGARYPATRRFRFAIPSLQLKSGVRFEFRNRFEKGDGRWAIDFYFGTSKEIMSVPLDRTLQARFASTFPQGWPSSVATVLSDLSAYLADADLQNMQRVWCHQGLGLTRPFMVLDELDALGRRLREALMEHPRLAQAIIDQAISLVFDEAPSPPPGLAKLARNAATIAAGLLIGSSANAILERGFELEARPRPAVGFG